MKKRSDKKTFKAKVDIVMFPDNIKDYSQKRNDYTELALTAIRQKPDVIQYIPSSYKDYSILCEEAFNQKYETFLLIKDSVSNYKQLGIKLIFKYPFLVSSLSKETKYYYFFWELAVSICYKVLGDIYEEDKELFSLIEKVIQREPLAIYYVNSKISIYNKLCNIAYSKDKESIKYIDINYVDKYLALEMIRKEPEIIRYLDSSKEYYKEACKIALSINGQLIKYVNYTSIDELIDNVHYSSMEDTLNYLFELINIAKNNAPEIVNYSIVFNAMRLENRKRKEIILSVSNKLGNDVDKLLREIDDEYDSLLKKYRVALHAEIGKEKAMHFNAILDCPIKVKTKKINIRQD